MEYTHTPVMLRECVDGLDIHADGIYADATLGRGGHGLEIVRRLTTGRLIAFDTDAQAIEESSVRLAQYADKITFVHSNFSRLAETLKDLGIAGVDGVLFDLGVSSPQLDDESRGFSYMADAPLDMRMDRQNPLTAWEIVNRWPEQELRRIFYEYGEERYSSRIAANIVRRRENKTIDTTFELVDVIKSSVPAAAKREKQHPAKRVFQAVRIAVNDELESLSSGLNQAMDALNPGGRLVVISFHSLEDRIVKNAIRSRENGCTCPPGLPVCVCGFVKTMESVTRKPLTPTEQELRDNPRSRSAKVRIARKI